MAVLLRDGNEGRQKQETKRRTGGDRERTKPQFETQGAAVDDAERQRLLIALLVGGGEACSVSPARNTDDHKREDCVAVWV